MEYEPVIPKVVAVPSLKTRRHPNVIPAPVGIVAIPKHAAVEPRAAAIGVDITFPPLIGECPNVNISFHGGAVGTADPVQLLFWGSIWQTSLALLQNSLTAAVQSILAGPYMSGMRQYGVRPCSFGGALIVATNPPLDPKTFDDGTIQDLVYTLIDNGTFPEPDEPGGRNLYFVIMPPNTKYGPGGARGAHSVASDYDFPADVDKAWVAWVGNNPLNDMLSTFCHELVEMCSDPENDAWFIDGVSSKCSEIGDLCNAVDGVLNGVNVESYWSIFDNACLIPTAWSVRRTLAGAGKRLDGRGLRSLQDPIPSLNQLIVNL